MRLHGPVVSWRVLIAVLALLLSPDRHLLVSLRPLVLLVSCSVVVAVVPASLGFKESKTVVKEGVDWYNRPLPCNNQELHAPWKRRMDYLGGTPLSVVVARPPLLIVGPLQGLEAPAVVFALAEWLPDRQEVLVDPGVEVAGQPEAHPQVRVPVDEWP